MLEESTQDLVARLKATLRNMADLEADIWSREIGSSEANASQLLQQAYGGLVRALRDSIAFRTGEAARSESALVEREFYDASADFSLSEQRLRSLGGEPFQQLWDRRDAARERWESALRKLCLHRSTCSKSLAVYSM
ncbi:MAG: hypothetical protein WCF17_12035 [Terracidiphilus sp.]